VDCNRTGDLDPELPRDESRMGVLES
jgi:hypothetical protein